MRPKGSKKELEGRRRAAIALLQAGHGVNETARELGTTGASVSRWKKAFDKDGPAGLDPKPGPGSKPLMTDGQHRELAKLLLKGARAHGFLTELWTLERVARVIDDRFGIRYHRGHVWRILRRIGFSLQKPATRARERDEALIETWKTDTWPEARKKGAPKDA